MYSKQSSTLRYKANPLKQDWGISMPIASRNRHSFMLDAHHHSLFEEKASYRGAFYSCLLDDIKRLPERKLKTSLYDRLDLKLVHLHHLTVSKLEDSNTRLMKKTSCKKNTRYFF